MCSTELTVKHQVPFKRDQCPQRKHFNSKVTVTMSERTPHPHATRTVTSVPCINPCLDTTRRPLTLMSTRGTSKPFNTGHTNVPQTRLEPLGKLALRCSMQTLHDGVPTATRPQRSTVHMLFASEVVWLAFPFAVMFLANIVNSGWWRASCPRPFKLSSQCLFRFSTRVCGLFYGVQTLLK